MGVNIPNITWVIKWKLADHLTLAVFMQKIGHAGRKASIPAVLVLFVEKAYFFARKRINAYGDNNHKR